MQPNKFLNKFNIQEHSSAKSISISHLHGSVSIKVEENSGFLEFKTTIDQFDSEKIIKDIIDPAKSLNLDVKLGLDIFDCSFSTIRDNLPGATISALNNRLCQA